MGWPLLFMDSAEARYTLNTTPDQLAGIIGGLLAIGGIFPSGKTDPKQPKEHGYGELVKASNKHKITYLPQGDNTTLIIVQPAGAEIWPPLYQHLRSTSYIVQRVPTGGADLQLQGYVPPGYIENGLHREIVQARIDHNNGMYNATPDGSRLVTKLNELAKLFDLSVSQFNRILAKYRAPDGPEFKKWQNMRNLEQDAHV